MADASSQSVFVTPEAAFQQQLAKCIDGLAALRASGHTVIPPETRNALMQFLGAKAECLPGALSPQLDAAAPSVQVSAAECSAPFNTTAPARHATPLPSTPRRTSWADKVRSGAEAGNSNSESTAAKVGYSREYSPPPMCGIEMGKFGSCEGLRQYPSGDITHFEQGLLRRIGMPHLEFFKAMQSEHCEETGCDMKFTTRNYGISTCAAHEWNVVVCGVQPVAEHMSHGSRCVPDVDEKHRSAIAKKAGLRREEVIAVILYTGPMYVVYNAVLSRFPDTVFDQGSGIWATLDGQTGLARNVFASTLNVLVSAVQKLRMVTVYQDGLRLCVNPFSQCVIVTFCPGTEAPAARSTCRPTSSIPTHSAARA